MQALRCGAHNTHLFPTFRHFKARGMARRKTVKPRSKAARTTPAQPISAFGCPARRSARLAGATVINAKEQPSACSRILGIEQGSNASGINDDKGAPSIRYEEEGEEERLLHSFDLDPSFGPFVGITRKSRWHRAVRFGLHPPCTVGHALTSLGDAHHLTAAVVLPH